MVTNEYTNLPWSKIPGLSWIFDRSVKAVGSMTTLNFTKIGDRDRENYKLRGLASANLKFISALAKDPKDERSEFSIDAGQNGNPFQGHYFDLNERHMKGELFPMRMTKESMEGTRVNTLTIRPKTDKNDSSSNSTTIKEMEEL